MPTSARWPSPERSRQGRRGSYSDVAKARRSVAVRARLKREPGRLEDRPRGDVVRADPGHEWDVAEIRIHLPRRHRRQEQSPADPMASSRRRDRDAHLKRRHRPVPARTSPTGRRCSSPISRRLPDAASRSLSQRWWVAASIGSGWKEFRRVAGSFAHPRSVCESVCVAGLRATMFHHDRAARLMDRSDRRTRRRRRCARLHHRRGRLESRSRSRTGQATDRGRRRGRRRRGEVPDVPVGSASWPRPRREPSISTTSFPRTSR